MKLDTIICGDVFDKLPEIPTGTAHCVVTSPPYWGLRDYGVDGQLGLEKTPEDYVAKMVEVFREVWRVLRDDGSLWLNLGDSYASGGRGGGQDGPAGEKQRSNQGALLGAKKPPPGLKPKDLCGIPWRVAFALQADGWYLRQDIIWHKPNPMPESVRDRCTKAHEYIFLMTKKSRYYYDAEAIKENTLPASHERAIRAVSDSHKNINIPGQPQHTLHKARAHGDGYNVPATRNKRSVWTVPTAPYKEAHFATFPPDLILPCILAGCPQWVCKKCGEPRRRIVDRIKSSDSTYETRGKTRAQCGVEEKTAYNSGFKADGKSTTTGWTDCNCNAGFDGGTVLDPFMGSGTVAAVSYENNRHYIGIDLNPDQKIQKRITDVHDKYALFESINNDKP